MYDINKHDVINHRCVLGCEGARVSLPCPPRPPQTPLPSTTQNRKQHTTQATGRVICKHRKQHNPPAPPTAQDECRTRDTAAPGETEKQTRPGTNSEENKRGAHQLAKPIRERVDRDELQSIPNTGNWDGCLCGQNRVGGTAANKAQSLPLCGPKEVTG